MSSQQENSRMDEDNISDKNIDVTRSQNRQAVENANEGQNVSNPEGGASHGHRGGDETGSHKEGQAEYNSMKPFVDKEGAGETGAGGEHQH